MNASNNSERKYATIHYMPDVPALTDLCVGKYDLVRGDFIIDTSDTNYGYRSSGMYFFNGKTIIEPCVEYDDYGTVPKEFKLLSEFPPGYWDLPIGNTGSINVHREFHYVRKNGNLVAFDGPPRKIDANAYWHHPENCGISPVTLDVSRVVTVGNNVVIRYKKYAIISHLTVEETQAALKSQHIWWIRTEKNVNKSKHDAGVSEIADELKVDLDDILTSIIF